jgi:hypothetical protein
MKSNKRRDEPSTETETREQFPLELVAATALRFLNEDELRRSDSGLQRAVVNSAICFLKICAERIEFDRHDASSHAEQLRELKSLGWNESDIIPYKEGIRFITGQNRSDRAQKHYEAYLKDYHKWGPSPASEFRDALKEDKEKGFSVETLSFHRVAFEDSRARRRLGLKRRKMLQKHA